MATEYLHGNRIKLRAYAGTDPATGRRQYLYDSVPADIGKRELDRRKRELEARAHALAESRRDRRRHPAAPKQSKPKPKIDRTVADVVEAWWAARGSKLTAAKKRRSLIDGLILPHLGDLKVALLAGTPPDDPADRDPDITYLSEKWAEIRRIGRQVGDHPLKASVIQTAHASILGPALRRAGHPIPDPGLPAAEAIAETTPLPEEMTGFLPFLGDPGTIGGYTATRRVRGSDKIITYTVGARAAEPTAMDLMVRAFALLVANGPRPVEAAAITRAQLDGTDLELDGRGVIEDDDYQPVIVGGESVKRRRRRITLDARCVAALRAWVKFQDEYALALGARLGPRSLIFSLDPSGKEPLSPKVLSKAFARCVQSASTASVSLPDGFCLYSMRHFGITQMLRNGKGRNVAAVAKRFGTSTRMIEERYEHAIPSDDAALADGLTAVWGDGDVGQAAVVDLNP